MTEPTKEQWKERALIAEALLEERTQECERLQAEMDIIKAQVQAPDIKLGDNIEIEGMGKFVVQRIYPQTPEGADWNNEELRKFLAGDQWEDRLLRGLEDKRKIFNELYGGFDPGRRKEKAWFPTPMDKYAVAVTEDLHNGEHRIDITSAGKPDMAVNFRRGYLRSTPPVDVARVVAREVATKWYLDSGEEDSLATLLTEKIHQSLRGKRKDRGWR